MILHDSADTPLWSWVGVCGPRGSGKTEIAAALSKLAPSEAKLAERVRSEAGHHRGHRLRASLGVGSTPGAGAAWPLCQVGRRVLLLADPEPTADLTFGELSSVVGADVVCWVVDATQGLTPEARRWISLVKLLGGSRVVVALNKVDLLEYSEASVAHRSAELLSFASALNLTAKIVPVAANGGDNLSESSSHTPWYQGPSLLAALEEAATAERPPSVANFRFAVGGAGQTLPGTQPRAEASAARSAHVTGAVLSGQAAVGDKLRLEPSGEITTLVSITSGGEAKERATPGGEVCLTFANAPSLPVALVTAQDCPAEVAGQFEATVIWLDEARLLGGRSYRLSAAGGQAQATVAPIKYKFDLESLAHIPTKSLGHGEIGVCNLQLDEGIAFDPYEDNPDTGSFVIKNRSSGKLLGIGLLHFALRRAKNVHWQAVGINKQARSELKSHLPCVLWYTGLSGAGKSTIANLVDMQLYRLGCHTYLLDGDNVRHGLNKDLGFTDADRVENIRRIAEVAKLMVDAGLMVSTAFISPFRAERRLARSLLGPGEFLEIHVATPLHVAEERDPKGLYKKARSGALKNFTGIDSPYEEPTNPELRVDTGAVSAEEAAERVIALLYERGILRGT